MLTYFSNYKNLEWQDNTVLTLWAQVQWEKQITVGILSKKRFLSWQLDTNKIVSMSLRLAKTVCRMSSVKSKQQTHLGIYDPWDCNTSHEIKNIHF